MALSDCEKCWDTPCSCGYEYRNWGFDYLVGFMLKAVRYKTKEQALKIINEVYHRAVLSDDFKGKETDNEQT